MTPRMALGGAHHLGDVTVREMPPCTMITIKGDLGSSKLQKAARAVTGADFPGACEGRFSGEGGLLWMAPDELLALAPRVEQHKALGKITAALSGTHHLAADVSDARSIFRLEGEAGAVRDVLAKLSPADVRRESLPEGIVRRTRLAQVPAAFWMRDAGTAEVVAFRSVSEYVFGLLKVSAVGGAVGHF